MPGKPAAKPQRERFIEASRELGLDESPEHFERVFGEIVPPKKAGDVAPPAKGKTPK